MIFIPNDDDGGKKQQGKRSIVFVLKRHTKIIITTLLLLDVTEKAPRDIHVEVERKRIRRSVEMHKALVFSHDKCMINYGENKSLQGSYHTRLLIYLEISHSTARIPRFRMSGKEQIGDRKWISR